MQKAVFKLEVNDEKVKRKVLKTVVGLPVNLEYKKLTVIGDIDPVSIASKLRKLCHTELVSVGPAKEPEKKDDKKKKDDDETKKDDEKKKKEELDKARSACTVDACVIC